MNMKAAVRRNLYYTGEHEWIDFQGTVAFVGVCPFKLATAGGIQQVLFSEDTGHTRQGAIIATLVGEKYRIPVHMPVDGKVIRNNNALPPVIEQNAALPGNDALRWLADQWIVQVSPSHPYERMNLLRTEEYLLRIKRKF